VVAFGAFALVAAAAVALVAGALSFFALQVYLVRLFVSYGTHVTADAAPDDRFLTLNGVRFDPAPLP
jgi:hypothetical protein